MKRKNRSIYTLFLLLSLAQVTVTGLAVGFLGFQSSITVYQRSLDTLRQSQLTQSMDNIHYYLHSAPEMTTLMAGLIERGQLDTSRQDELIAYLWQVTGNNPHISTLAWADNQGRYLGANRQENYLTATACSNSGRDLLRYTPIPDDLTASFSANPIKRAVNYDPRHRNWFQEAAAAGDTIWTDVNFSITSRRLDTTAATPVYTIDAQGEKTLLGVVMADVSLNRLSRELKNLTTFPQGETFIFDYEEALIAASNKEEPFIAEGDSLRRLSLGDAGEPLLHELGTLIQLRRAIETRAKSSQIFETKLRTRGPAEIILTELPANNLFTCAPPAWQIVVVLPTSYYQAPLKQGLGQSALFMVLLLLLSLVVTLLLTQHMLQPLRELTASVKTLSQGRWIKPEISQRDDEVGQISRAVLNMTIHIRETLARLRQENRERKRAQDRLSQSLEEKEVLLKEIHHRVKNNMQIISSLVSLEESSPTQDNTNNAGQLNDLSNRVNTIALVHEKLYQSEDFAHFALEEFLPDLANSMSNLIPRETRIHFEYHLTPLLIPINQAVPLGLFVSEVVSNALKYAYPGAKYGTILYENLVKENGQIELIITDRGRGFDLEEARRSGRLGLILMDSLVNQMGGTLTIETPKLREGGQGTRYRLSFPLTF